MRIRDALVAKYERKTRKRVRNVVNLTCRTWFCRQHLLRNSMPRFVGFERTRLKRIDWFVKVGEQKYFYENKLKY